MTNIFKRDYERYEGVRPINIYLLRTLFLLMFLFVGYDAWSYILRHQGPWDPVRAAAWCMFASYSALSILGVFRPLRMLPIILFMIVYKSTWLLAVAYPLWRADQLAGSPAEGMARVFVMVPAAIVIVPWKYVFDRYILNRQPYHS
jgi:hypothetical protein